ncbi:type VI secretion system Vgr family protein [Xenophilus sp. Marseille-Q4582]|uniref:type VI secretion system Vgr family protein n=1 Tax=Xenophilus sp. Marseille-Q4582 TaxID=2866600 RepID=UPI001CE3C27C|nr:type VI secretion system tip protein TssI/VgrG [Xenophilus sp. Marseille-Q4582]
MASSTDYRIDTDSPAGGDLLFWSLIGHEALSRPSVYELTVLSANPHIQAADILGRSFDVAIGFEDADGNPHERHCQGVAVRFARLHALGRYHEYRIELRSWFWLLHKRRNSRILGDDKDEGAAKNVLEILDIVLENSPIRAIKKLRSDGLGTHDARGYSVQYQESDYHYLSRLLEDEGIYYWFDAHAEPGTMRLADNAAVAHAPLPVADTLHHAPGGASEARFNDVWSWESERKLDTGWFDSRDSNYRKIRTKLGAIGADLEEHELADFEEFEFPGGYQEPDASELVLGRRVDELRSRRERHWALTGWPDVAPGCSFTYEGDPDTARNGKYLIGGCIVVAVHPGHESVPRPPSDPWAVRRMLDRALENDAVNGDTADTLRRLVDSSPSLRELVVGTRAFLVTVWPLSVPYKPPRLTPRVRMPGPQSAIVVGPKGEEIPENGEDLYVDAYGRVKVFFHWNRYEKGKKDFDGQKWTCWLRVSQPWAGKKWGGYFAPRIGQEVIVDFLDGDPDRPLITGRVYNDDQPIPYASPTQSGFKTRSTPNGKPANYNEIMFEDRKGQENINIHAERNMSTSVEVDDSLSVGRDQTEGVKRDHTTTVGRNDTNSVAEKQENTIGVRQINTIGGGGQLTQVAGFQENIYHAGQKTSVKGMQNLIVTANQDVAIGGFQKTVVGANMDVGVVGFQTTSVGADAALLVNGNTKIQTGGERNDVTNGKHAIMANEVKVIAGKVETMSVGDINATSMGSNTTVLGANSNGYIGSATDVSIGMSRSTFMGLSMSNALAIDIANFAGLQIENTAALRLQNVAAAYIGQNTIEVELSTLKTISGGAGNGPAVSAASAGSMLAGLAVGAGAAIRGLFDVGATIKQYLDAASDLETAAEEARSQGLTSLSTRLSGLARTARLRAAEGVAGVVAPGLVGIGESVASDVAVAKSAWDFVTGAKDSGPANAGLPPVTPPAPVLPDLPDMPPLPPPYQPPGGH